MFLGGHSDLSLISNMTRVNAGFSGCVRRLQVNSKLFDMRKARHVGDALYGVDVGKTVSCWSLRDTRGYNDRLYA